MKKSLYEIFFFMVAVILPLVCCGLYTDNANKTIALKLSNLRADTYARANGKQIAYAKIKQFPLMFLNIENEIGTPKELLQAIKAHENSSDIIDFGVKKIPLQIVKDCSPDEWQSRGASKVAVEEAFKLIFSDDKIRNEYFKVLGVRYCFNDREGWTKDVRQIYGEIKERTK